MRYHAAHLDGVPDGVKLTITWCGGNGPHEYVVRWGPYGSLRAVYSTNDAEHDVGEVHQKGQLWTLHEISIPPLPESPA